MTDFSKLTGLINLCIEKNIPFVSFRKQGKNDIESIVQLSGKFQMVKTIKDVINLSGFVYAPFHEKTLFPVMFFEPEHIFINDQIPDSFLEKIQKRSIMYPRIEENKVFSTQKDLYLQQADKFIKSFDKQLKKAILSRQIVKTVNNFNVASVFINLCKAYPDAFCHIINIPGSGIWMGATPETLFHSDEKKAFTLALAGTRKKVAITEKWEAKELAEQHFVTEHIRSILNKFRVDSFKEAGPKTIVAGGVEHLATTFEFGYEIIKDRLAEFLNTLHPTPAVCGLPVHNALEIILNTESFNREYYAGFMGLLNTNKENLLMVNLRCMKLVENQITLFVGGGLTAQSEVEKEWIETELKAETLLGYIA